MYIYIYIYIGHTTKLTVATVPVSDLVFFMQLAHLLPSASLVESGSSFLLVSGSKRTRAPLTTARLLKTMMGIDWWYTANMLSNGDSNPATLYAMEPKPTAVCLKEWNMEIIFNYKQCM